ncbi:hypothetical protein SHI21_17120 [Bacteriovorax sp. PP10]|uniref:Uncharacterized protein n=1 Tax=Bacteriovorax antarcticus TaxID=3088717 RepID=A0ABU5VY19_9BACT|nr:hypothetical protein [Bacteriovorax sp. PP10]MEA9357956.1 hypothetical protein [Bacteriovorax sp. PP10]
MRRINSLFLMMAIFALSTQQVFAWGSTGHASIPKPTQAQIDAQIKQTITDSEGNTFKVALIEYKNQNDEMEVRIEASAIPRFASKINPLLGFGRDLDGNGKIDIWFLVTQNGLDLVEKEGKDSKGRDVLGDILVEKYRSTFFMYVNAATTSIFSYLLMSFDASITSYEDYYRDWMDLEQVRLTFEKDQKNLGSTYTRDQIAFQYELREIGLKEMNDRMARFEKATFWGYALADLGLWVTGGIIFKWGAKILAKIGAVTSETAFATAVKDSFFGFFEKQKAAVESRLVALKGKIPKPRTRKEIAAEMSAVTLTKETYKQAITSTIKAQQSKSRLHAALKKVLKIPKDVFLGAKSEWQYIALNSGVQILSEGVARYDDIYDANPAVMAENLLTNPEVIENVGFMSADTILMTGVSKSLKTTKARFMASGAIALTNSSIMNFAIKDSADLTRVAFDTGWETIIGNGQVQLDLKALEYFEKMAQKKGNPKIKLVGYVIALVDMGVGYVTYSKATTKLDEYEAKKQAEKDKEKNEPKIMLVPVLAEQ